MQRLIFILSLFILAIVGCSSNESHSFLIRPDGGGEDATTEIEVGKTIPAWQEGVMDIHFINTTTGESMFVIPGWYANAYRCRKFECYDQL